MTDFKSGIENGPKELRKPYFKLYTLMRCYWHVIVAKCLCSSLLLPKYPSAEVEKPWSGAKCDFLLFYSRTKWKEMHSSSGMKTYCYFSLKLLNYVYLKARTDLWGNDNKVSPKILSRNFILQARQIMPHSGMELKPQRILL